MFQAIVTKYMGPTNFRGSRVKASAQAGSVILQWDDALNSTDNHMLAATALAAQKGWLADGKRKLVGGGMPDGKGNCYVLVDA